MNKKLIVALFIIPAFFLVKLVSSFPELIETYYSTGFYPFVSKLFRYSLGWLPFSFGDIVYAFAIIYSVRWLFKNKKRMVTDFKNWLIDIFAAVSILYIAFHVFWGLNYYRLPLHTALNLEAEYTTEKLVEVTKRLISKSNTIHLKLVKNDSVKVYYPYTKLEIVKKVPKGYLALQKTFKHLKYEGVSIKKSLWSLPLTYMGFSGYLNPLTNEAQINSLVPIFKTATTASHEVAHQLGYAAENEANFIGCLAAVSNDDIYFKYSGYTFALRHCLHEVYKRNPELYSTLLQTINRGILKNYEEVRTFWRNHENPLEPLFKETYSVYLKANSQKDGIKSYSYVVALLVNYFESNSIIH